MRFRVVHEISPEAEKEIVQDKGLIGFHDWIKNSLSEQVTEALIKKIQFSRKELKNGNIAYEVYGFIIINADAEDLNDLVATLVKQMI
jgi:hypothetical protein